MKFNFNLDNLKRKAKKAVTVAVAAGLPLAAVSQTNKEGQAVVQEISPFLVKLKTKGLVPKDMSEKEFQDLKDNNPGEFERLTKEYMKSIGAVTPKEADEKYGEDRETIKKEKYGIKQIEESTEVDTSLVPTFDFNEWFSEQIKLGNEGKTIKAPDGQLYLIVRNPNYKKQSPKTKKINSPQNGKGVLANKSIEKKESFVLLDPNDER
jgi:hypothetical protein